jgi:hypothetical protein
LAVMVSRGVAWGGSARPCMAWQSGSAGSVAVGWSGPVRARTGVAVQARHGRSLWDGRARHCPSWPGSPGRSTQVGPGMGGHLPAVKARDVSEGMASPGSQGKGGLGRHGLSCPGSHGLAVQVYCGVARLGVAVVSRCGWAGFGVEVTAGRGVAVIASHGSSGCGGQVGVRRGSRGRSDRVPASHVWAWHGSSRQSRSGWLGLAGRGWARDGGVWQSGSVSGRYVSLRLGQSRLGSHGRVCPGGQG